MGASNNLISGTGFALTEGSRGAGTEEGERVSSLRRWLRGVNGGAGGGGHTARLPPFCAHPLWFRSVRSPVVLGSAFGGVIYRMEVPFHV